MVTRAFAREDGILGAATLVTARNRLYKDIDLSFEAKPSGDVYKKVDAAAVKQAVKNLLLTNHGEKPFEPFYGANLQGLLFDLTDDETSVDIDIAIRQAIAKYEPRARVLTTYINLQPEYNSVAVTVEFQIVNTEETVILETTIARLR